MEKLNMNATQNYLLGVNNKFSQKANRTLHYFMAFLFLIQGISRLLSGRFDNSINYVFGGPLLLGGLYFLWYAHYAFSPNSKYAARVELTEETLLIKKNFFKKPVTIDWSDMQAMELGNYTLGFKIYNEMHYFKYRTNPENSIKIKSALRNMAAEKGIEVN